MWPNLVQNQNPSSCCRWTTSDRVNFQKTRAFLPLWQKDTARISTHGRLLFAGICILRGNKIGRELFYPAVSFQKIYIDWQTSDWKALYPWCSQWHWSINVYRFSIIAGYWKLILLTIKSNWTFLMKCFSSVASIWWTSRVLTSFAKTWQPLRWIFI